MVLLGKLVAWAMLIIGILRTAMGFFVAFNFDDESIAPASARYLGSEMPGEAIDQGMLLIVAGIVIGLLATIARNTR